MVGDGDRVGVGAGAGGGDDPLLTACVAVGDAKGIGTLFSSDKIFVDKSNPSRRKLTRDATRAVKKAPTPIGREKERVANTFIDPFHQAKSKHVTYQLQQDLQYGGDQHRY
jgi:hypothetical protein